MTADINMGGSYQVVNLRAPVASGEALRQTTNITEADLEALTDGSDTDLHYHSPAFSVYMSADMTNIAINTTHTVQFDTERFDDGNDFDTATYIWTAPYDCRVLFAYSINFTSVDQGATRYEATFFTSNHQYAQRFNSNKFTGDPFYLPMTDSIVCEMDEGDTARIIVYQTGGTAQTDLLADAKWTRFGGHVIKRF